MQNKQTLNIMAEVEASIKKLDNKLTKAMKREQAILTPEEARTYEKFTVGNVQVMARFHPVASTDSKTK